MNNYIKGLGILIGKYTEKDLQEEKDKKDFKEAEKKYNLHYSNTKIIKEKGIKKIALYICNVYDFKI